MMEAGMIVAISNRSQTVAVPDESLELTLENPPKHFEKEEDAGDFFNFEDDELFA
jgi:hypothetical protein